MEPSDRPRIVEETAVAFERKAPISSEFGVVWCCSCNCRVLRYGVWKYCDNGPARSYRYRIYLLTSKFGNKFLIRSIDIAVR